MASIEDYNKNLLKQNIGINEQINKILKEFLLIKEDIEANAQAIQELAEIIGGE